MTLDAFELDESLHPALARTLAAYQREQLSVTIRPGDYIHAAVDSLTNDLFTTAAPRYTHAILNPPYRKISSDSAHRAALRRAGIETVNLYSAFVALALAQLCESGQLVAIIPRSFCNGPYYRPFRDFLLDRAAIRHMHLFESRTTAFKDDEVLQENLIIRLERGARQGSVTVSTSTDSTFSDLATHDHPFDHIVLPDDPARFIHVPTTPGPGMLGQSPGVRIPLADLGLRVSTGPVIDFRMRQHLRHMPGSDTAPLLYPVHVGGHGTTWPIEHQKKPNAIVRNADSERWLYPNGWYCVVRRFSSKEERRRIVAGVVDPSLFGSAAMLGFENHLNVFHENRRGLPEALARGLAVFLNTTAVDEAFRRFNGHTQVNATDLALMKYPSREALIRLGEWAMRQGELSQSVIDDHFGAVAA